MSATCFCSLGPIKFKRFKKLKKIKAQNMLVAGVTAAESCLPPDENVFFYLATVVAHFY